jgi:hypothetical protein
MKDELFNDLEEVPSGCLGCRTPISARTQAGHEWRSTTGVILTDFYQVARGRGMRLVKLDMQRIAGCASPSHPSESRFKAQEGCSLRSAD